jgi:hypothetical protein
MLQRMLLSQMHRARKLPKQRYEMMPQLQQLQEKPKQALVVEARW